MTARRRFAVVAAAGLVALVAGIEASAQTLRIDGATSRTVQAAPDFAAEVIGDPWDFDSPSDYDYTYSLGEDTPQDQGNEFTAWQPYPSVANGVFTGVTREAVPALQMLFSGVPGAMNDVLRTGVRHPIDTSRYAWLSFRVKRSWTAADVETMKALWEEGRRGAGLPVGVLLFLARGYDNDMGRWVNQQPLGAQGGANEWQVYRFRLSDAVSLSNNRFGGHPWQGLIRASASPSATARLARRYRWIGCG